MDDISGFFSDCFIWTNALVSPDLNINSLKLFVLLTNIKLNGNPLSESLFLINTRVCVVLSKLVLTSSSLLN